MMEAGFETENADVQHIKKKKNQKTPDHDHV